MGITLLLECSSQSRPTEKFFGRIRQFGRVNDNPTVAEMVKSTQTLRVINSIRLMTSLAIAEEENERDWKWRTSSMQSHYLKGSESGSHPFDMLKIIV